MRYKAYKYDERGRMPLAEMNTLGQIIYNIDEADVNWRYGQASRKTVLGVQGVYRFEYDIFGRNKKVTSPEQISAMTDYKWSIQTGGSNSYTEVDNAVFQVTKTASNSSNYQKVWRDRLGRTRATETLNLTGDKIRGVTTYNESGNVDKVRSPFIAGNALATGELSEYLYDALNRPSGVTTAIGTATVAHSYDANYAYATITDYAGVTKISRSDKSGALDRMTDQGGTLDYTYNASGQPLAVRLNGTLTTQNTFDSYLRHTSATDPNSGTYEYEYNAYGELTAQTDNAANTYTLAYDDAGRVTQRLNAATTEATDYKYVPDGTNGVNQIAAIYYSNGVYDSYEYDSYGRTTLKTQGIDGIAADTKYTYANGRIKTMVYPSGYELEYGV